ncbi:hypothetical protein K504DRAFT_486408 [Pleomassaria siparia CBS 279.74]|uniref:Uncharacterized protein n=1 Tax=Pleomassaria siparia CBS 279.74 TaxID=1314801 RepID=A0A6G1KQB6_9PLEO|nr:hypothetical protein K504DRAFT_486408 [Pleomassaria siparia CBS 279.74]
MSYSHFCISPMWIDGLSHRHDYFHLGLRIGDHRTSFLVHVNLEFNLVVSSMDGATKEFPILLRGTGYGINKEHLKQQEVDFFVSETGFYMLQQDEIAVRNGLGEKGSHCFELNSITRRLETEYDRPSIPEFAVRNGTIGIIPAVWDRCMELLGKEKRALINPWTTEPPDPGAFDIFDGALSDSSVRISQREMVLLSHTFVFVRQDSILNIT